MNLQLVTTPETLYQGWPQVRAGLQKLLDKMPDNWMPEDVYHGLKTGRFILIVDRVSASVIDGFMVLQIHDDFAGKTLHIFALYNQHGAPALTEYWPLIKNFATHHGCQRITAASRRRGWERTVKRYAERVKKTVLYEVAI